MICLLNTVLLDTCIKNYFLRQICNITHISIGQSIISNWFLFYVQILSRDPVFIYVIAAAITVDVPSVGSQLLAACIRRMSVHFSRPGSVTHRI